MTLSPPDPARGGEPCPDDDGATRDASDPPETSSSVGRADDELSVRDERSEVDDGRSDADDERVPITRGLVVLGVLALVIGLGLGLILSSASLVR